MTTLTPGANAALPASASTATVRLSAASGDADLIVLLLDAGGQADGDDGVVLFSQPVSAGGAVALDLPSNTVTIRLGSLRPAVERVLVVAQADGSPGVTSCGTLTAHVAADGVAVAEAPFGSLPAVATLQLVELYRRAGAWKVRALGDGYAGGLAKLLTVHGITVDDAPQAAAPSLPAQPINMRRPGRVAAPAPAPPAPAAPAPAAPAAPAAATPTPPAAPAPAAAAPPTPLNLKKAEGKLNLRKGDQAVVMTKTERIIARVSWNSGTDYDVFALVLMRDGTTVAVATFAAEGVPPLMEHAGVRHLGDVMAAELVDTFAERTGSGAFQALRGRGDEVSESLEIRLTPEVLAVVPVAYSAIGNGGGSFKHYKVSLAIDNGAGTKITIPPRNASDNPGVYTCVPGIIKNTASGVVIEPLEWYSKSGSEKRPAVRLQGGEVVVEMDAGPVNLEK